MRRYGVLFLGVLAVTGEAILVCALIVGGFALALHWLLRTPLRVYLKTHRRGSRELPSLFQAIDALALVWIARGVSRAKREPVPAGPQARYRLGAGKTDRVPF